MGENSNKTFVIDASMVMSFLLHENNDQANIVLKKIQNDEINLISPKILKFEIGNGLRSAILRKRINQTNAETFYQSFLELDIVEEEIDYFKVLKLAFSKKISFYDASYLYLAKSNSVSLLTLDHSLR